MKHGVADANIFMPFEYIVRREANADGTTTVTESSDRHQNPQDVSAELASIQSGADHRKGRVSKAAGGPLPGYQDSRTSPDAASGVCRCRMRCFVPCSKSIP